MMGVNKLGTYKYFCMGLAEGAHVEKEPVIDQSPQFGIFGLEWVVVVLFGVGVGQVHSNGSALVDAEIAILQRRHISHRIHLANINFRMSHYEKW